MAPYMHTHSNFVYRTGGGKEPHAQIGTLERLPRLKVRLKRRLSAAVRGIHLRPMTALVGVKIRHNLQCKPYLTLDHLF